MFSSDIRCCMYCDKYFQYMDQLPMIDHGVRMHMLDGFCTWNPRKYIRLKKRDIYKQPPIECKKRHNPVCHIFRKRQPNPNEILPGSTEHRVISLQQYVRIHKGLLYIWDLENVSHDSNICSYQQPFQMNDIVIISNGLLMDAFRFDSNYGFQKVLIYDAPNIEELKAECADSEEGEKA